MVSFNPNCNFAKLKIICTANKNVCTPISKLQTRTIPQCVFFLVFYSFFVRKRKAVYVTCSNRLFARSYEILMGWCARMNITNELTSFTVSEELAVDFCTFSPVVSDTSIVQFMCIFCKNVSCKCVCESAATCFQPLCTFVFSCSCSTLAKCVSRCLFLKVYLVDFVCDSLFNVFLDQLFFF